jgi:hypothetical protein
MGRGTSSPGRMARDSPIPEVSHGAVCPDARIEASLV